MNLAHPGGVNWLSVNTAPHRPSIRAPSFPAAGNRPPRSGVGNEHTQFVGVSC